MTSQTGTTSVTSGAPGTTTKSTDSGSTAAPSTSRPAASHQSKADDTKFVPGGHRVAGKWGEWVLRGDRYHGTWRLTGYPVGSVSVQASQGFDSEQLPEKQLTEEELTEEQLTEEELTEERLRKHSEWLRTQAENTLNTLFPNSSQPSWEAQSEREVTGEGGITMTIWYIGV
jgi:hypothetical protein